MGVKLIERDNKTLYLTEAGKEFLKHSKEILDKVKEITLIMKDINPESKKVLKLGFPPALGAWLWSVLYPDFVEQYPHIEIQVQDFGTKEILDAIKTGEIELGLGVLEMVDIREMENIRVKNGEIKVLLNRNHKLKGLNNISLEDLNEETYIQYKRNTTYIEEKMLLEFKESGIKPDIFYVKEQSSAYDLVSKGHGFTVSLDDSISIIKDNPHIISKSFTKPIYFTSGLIWRKDIYLSEAARDFIKYISQVIGKID